MFRMDSGKAEEISENWSELSSAIHVVTAAESLGVSRPFTKVYGRVMRAGAGGYMELKRLLTSGQFTVLHQAFI